MIMTIAMEVLSNQYETFKGPWDIIRRCDCEFQIYWLTVQISFVLVIFTLERPLACSTTRSESAINHKVSEKTKIVIRKIFFRKDREHFR